MNKIIIFVRVISLILTGVLFVSCQASEKNKWTPPKFVKEWEIKEIKPGLPHHIISMTANKNGVFVLVKVVEIKRVSLANMSADEKKKFVDSFIDAKLIPAKAFEKWTYKEKKDLVSFIEKYFMPPRKANEISTEEKEMIYNKFIQIGEMFIQRESDTFPYYKRYLDGEKESVKSQGIDSFFNKIALEYPSINEETVSHYAIQQYDSEGGQFIKAWHAEDIGFKEPLKILSDNSGGLVTADYASNEIIKFAANGSLEQRWKMLSSSQVGEGSMFSGVTIDNADHLLIIGQGDLVVSPKLFKYDLTGKLIQGKELKSKTETYFKLLKSLIPGLMKLSRISDIAVDNKGDIFLLGYKNITEDPSLLVLNPEWGEVKNIKVILNEGFEAARSKQLEANLNKVGVSFHGFDSSQLSWIENGPGLYFPANIVSGGHFLYVTFLGSKPFGIIDAVVYDSNGNKIGYWKQESRSHAGWYKNLNADIEVIDTNLTIAQYSSSVYVGRTMKVKEGAFYNKNVIQKFSKEEGK